MNAQAAYQIRAELAYGLRQDGRSFADIAAILRVRDGSKEEARKLVARGSRLEAQALARAKTFRHEPYRGPGV